MLLDLSSQFVNCYKYLTQDHLEVEECAAGKIIFAEVLPKSFCWVAGLVHPLACICMEAMIQHLFVPRVEKSHPLQADSLSPGWPFLFYVSSFSNYRRMFGGLLGRTSGVAFGVCVSS